MDDKENYNPEEARKQYDKFQNDVYEIRREIAKNKDDKKKLLAKFIEFITLLQDINPENRKQIMNEFNTELQSDGVPVGFNFQTENTRESKTITGGGNYDYLNEYNIRFEGGAAETPKEAPKETDQTKAQKVLDQLEEIRIKVNKIKNFVDIEVKPKYNGFRNTVFQKLYDYNNDPNKLKDDDLENAIDESKKTELATAKSEAEKALKETREALQKLQTKPTKTPEENEQITSLTTEVENKLAAAKKASKEYNDLMKGKFLQYTPAELDKPPIDNNNIVGLYTNLTDQVADNWLKSIKQKIGENRNELEKIRDELLSISEKEEVKQINPTIYKVSVKNAFDGDFSDQAQSDPDKQTGIIQRMDNIGKAIQSRFESARSALKPVATGFESAKATFEKTRPQIITRLSGGSKEDEVETEISKLTQNFTNVNDSIKKLQDVYKRRTNATYAASVSQPGMFTNILNKFKKDNFEQGAIVAAQKMEESLKVNKLLPEDVLRISNTDRFIFAFVILFLRAITIQITEYFISNGKIKTLLSSILVFNIIYSALFLILIAYVNLDTYRLRIIFNYINLNGNSGVIMMHLGMLYIISYGIYMIIHYLNFPIQKVQDIAVTEEDKAYLMYQLEIVTMIIWVFLLLLSMFL